MTSDKELTELAAISAGIEICWYKNPVWGQEYAYVGHVTNRWDPLGDDGDAFRLAVKCLPFHVLSYCREDYEYCGKDARAATRRAIVRAVADLPRIG